MVVFDRTNPPGQVQFKKIFGDAVTKPGVLITRIVAVLQLFVTSPSTPPYASPLLQIASEQWHRAEGRC